jgi:Activator of Hsp90 ATPase homolog 1-like protein
VTLQPDGSGTLLRLVHRGLPAGEVEQHAHGWDLYLGRLVTAGAGGDPGPDPNAG